MKKSTIIFPLILIALLISCSTQYKNLQASLPDLTEKNDGAYRGFYDLEGTPIKVTVDVIVRSKNIAEVKIVDHKCSPFGKKAEKITDRIIEKQSLDVDAVSGATGSSKAILKAVENALQ